MILDAENSLQLDWPQDVLDAIEYRQETAYRKAADLLGFAGPHEAFALLAEKPATGLSPEEFRRLIGWETFLSGEAWEQTKLKIKEADEREVRPSATRWEDVRVRQRWIGLQQDLSERFLDTFGSPLNMSPYLATLPAGDINARVSQSFSGDHLIIFLEHGLHRYFIDFACLVASTVPPITPATLLSDEALQKIKGPWTIPFQGSSQFSETLLTYVFRGTPSLNQERIHIPSYNRALYIWVLLYMSQFVLLHEQAHISLKHFAKRRFGHEVEIEADVSATGALSSLNSARGFSWALPFWAADLALLAFKILDTALGVAAHGWGPKWWISRDYPTPDERRKRLREHVPPDAPAAGRAALGNLLGMTDSLFGKIEDLHMPFVLLAHRKGHRPSPLWRERINRSIRPKEGSSDKSSRAGREL
jgi:hypothetical protein